MEFHQESRPGAANRAKGGTPATAKAGSPHNTAWQELTMAMDQ